MPWSPTAYGGYDRHDAGTLKDEINESLLIAQT